jgi:hypothetical protein
MSDGGRPPTSGTRRRGVVRREPGGRRISVRRREFSSGPDRVGSERAELDGAHLQRGAGQHQSGREREVADSQGRVFVVAAQDLRTCASGPAPPDAGPARAMAQGQDRDQETSGPETQVPGTKGPASQGRTAPVPTETARVLAVAEWSL